MNRIKLFFILLVIVAQQQVLASDLAKEKRWADQIVDSIMDGDAVWLNDGKSEFLGIYTEAENNKKRGVIVMHGTGIHPDWQQVIQPIRVGLTEHQWNTLSIQMPVLANEAEYKQYAPLYKEVPPRINAAIEFLKSRGTKEIILIGHSQGAAMSAYALSKNQSGVKGFIAIGMPSFANDEKMNSIKSLEKINIPVLDLYGISDLKDIINLAAQRKSAANKANNKKYIQKQIKGNHFFDGEEDKLVAVVAKWLEEI